MGQLYRVIKQAAAEADRDQRNLVRENAMLDTRLAMADLNDYDVDWDPDGGPDLYELLPPNPWTAMVMELAKEID